MSEAPARRRPRKGDVLELTLARLTPRGEGEGEHDGERVRVRGGVPGARVLASVARRKKGVIDARLMEVLEPSRDQVPARCDHVNSCGGCSFQTLAYPAQLKAQTALLKRTLQPLLAASPVEIAPIIGADETFGYRNKMDFTFSNRRWVESDEPQGAEASFALGLHVRGLYLKVIDVGTCHIAFPGATEIVATVRDLARARDLAPWDAHEHTGLLRHLVLRRSEASGEVLVNLVTSGDAPESIPDLARDVCAAHPEIATFVQSVNTRPAQIAVGEREHVLHGRGFLEEQLLGLAFRVSAASFFQTNTRQAERLAALVSDRVGEAQTVFDLCCGAGVLGLVAAARSREVIGFELVPEAVEDARRNAELNGVTNARFVAGDLAQTLLEGDYPPPDVCIADPPRAGLHPRVSDELRRLAPARLVYVSCNPSAAVRDLQAFVEQGYRLIAVEPIDLFPHTPHLECVLTLERS